MRATSRSGETRFDWEDEATWTPALAGVDAVMQEADSKQLPTARRVVLVGKGWRDGSVYNLDRFEKFMDEVRNLGLHERVKILAGVTPLKSAGMAKFMKKNVPTTVSSSVVPTTTAARQPMKTAKTATTMETDIARLTRKSFEASSTTTCCW